MLTAIGYHYWLGRAALVVALLVASHAIGAAAEPDAGVDSATVDVIPSGQFETLMKWGETALENERFGEAENCFRQVLDADWNNPQAFALLQKTRAAREATIKKWRGLAWFAEAAGRWDRAEQYYNLILRELPDDQAAAQGAAWATQQAVAQSRIDAGLERFVLGDFAGAQTEFERALDMRPGDSLVTLYLQRAEQETMQSSSLADIRADASAWTKYLDALKRFRAGDLPGAEALWRQVLEKYPGNESVLSNLEQVTRRRKKEFSAEDVNP